ncbi:MAG: SDR family oxidoreductase [Candidatus Hydrogenedentota bacterium]|mgnify:CR=1 FL=1
MSSPVAFITGASRGIGKAVAHKLAREGWDIVVAAKSVEEHPKLPGTIFSAAEELEQHGTRVLPVQCNVVDVQSVEEAARQTLAAFGRVDAVINNAGALWWKPMDETPMKRFDLVIDVNVRGAFAVTTAFLPAMKAQRSGHVVNMSPPIDLRMLPNHVAYCVGKFGMTMMVFGIAEEFKDYNIKASALWPATLVESQATINHSMGEREQWRKADILADATYEILRHPELSNGKALIDEDLLRQIGYTDFAQYACVPGTNPQSIRMIDRAGLA